MPVCLFNRIHPADVLQGHLGDCSLLAAMSALAESPELVRNLFAQKEVDEAGAMTFDFSHRSRTSPPCEMRHICMCVCTDREGGCVCHR
jgi:hypothetical protein